jgi:cation transport ATPase
MKKVVFIFSVFLIGFSTQGQEVKKEKNAKVAFEVNGICGMCKKRIETAALKTKGIKFAIWDVKTHQLNVILNEQKTSLTTLKTNIAAAGHDIKDFVATEEAYASVHPCCKYRDNKIVLSHEGELKKERK